MDCALRRSLTNATQTNPLIWGRHEVEMASTFAHSTCEFERVLYQTLVIAKVTERTGSAPVPLSSFVMVRADQVYS